MSGMKFSVRTKSHRVDDLIGLQDILLEYILGNRWRDYRQFSRILTLRLLEARPRTDHDIKSILFSLKHPFFLFNDLRREDFSRGFPSQDILRRIGDARLVSSREETRAKATRTPIGKKLRVLIIERDGFKCRYCGKTARETKLEVDHIMPVAKGGKTSLDNLETLCIDCNRGKSDLSINSPQ